MIDKQILINWLHNQIDMEISCVEDLEMTEGVENEYGRGRISAWEMMLDDLNHFEEQTKMRELRKKLAIKTAPGHSLLELYKRGK